MKENSFINLTDVFKAIYNFTVNDRIFHDRKTNGTFVLGETITGQTSGFTATVGTVETYSFRYTVLTGTPQVNEYVVGGTSAATCKILRLNTFHTAVGDRIYIEGAANTNINNILPYAVYSYRGERPQEQAYNKGISSIDLRWELFDNNVTIENMLTLISKLYKLFNRGEITIGNHTFHSCLHTQTSDIVKDINNIWSCEVMYKFLVSSN